MRGLLRDIRGGLRVYAKTPGHFAVMIATLALGTGVNVAAFSVADATLLRPLPIDDPDGLVRIVSSFPAGSFSYPDYVDLSSKDSVVASLAATTPNPVELLEDSETSELLLGSLVSGNFFSVLGVRPRLGRAFLPDEDGLPQGKPVVLVSHDFWNRRFQNGELHGQTLRLSGTTYEIVGVAPAHFAGITRGVRTDFWIPVTTQGFVLEAASRNRLTNWDTQWLSLVGRLQSGVSRAQAASVLKDHMQRANQLHGRLDAKTDVSVCTDWEATFQLSPRSTLLQLLLVGLVAIVLLLACVNVGNLILAKAITRRKEIAVRMAIGATRGRITRQLLTEGFVVACLGALLGLGLAKIFTNFVSGYRPADAPFLAIDARLDGRVLAAAAGAAALATLIFGLAPVLDARKWDLSAALRTRRPQHRRWGRLGQGGRGALVTVQVAICTLLLVHTGLLARSLHNAWRVDLGFRTDVLMASVWTDSLRLSREDLASFWARLLERVRGLPGVEKASFVNDLPFNLNGWIQPIIDGKEQLEPLNRIYVGPDYFEVMGIPIVRGRGFRAEDASPDANGIVIDQAAAERFWPGEDPMGKEFRTSILNKTSVRVAGLARTSVYSIGTPAQEWRMRMYVAIEKQPRQRQVLYIHSNVPPEALRDTVADLVREADPRAYSRTLTMADSLGEQLLLMQVGQLVLGAMAVLGLLLAAIGLYGVLSFDVGRRTHEFGVRLAVGAEPQSLGWLVVTQSLPVLAFGLILGAGAAAITTQFVRDMLVGVGPLDPATFLAVAVVVAITSMAAVSFPAWRASRSSPLQALRTD